MNFAFAGKMRAGKDSCADYLMNLLPDVMHLSLAAPIYDILYAAQDIVGDKSREKHRAFLQFVGTEWGRNTYGQNIWVDTLLRKAMLNPDRTVICTDARFDNELFALKKAGFYCVHVTADEAIRIARGATNLDHPSENGIIEFKDFDYHIDGGVHLLQMHEQLNVMLNKLGLRAIL